MPAGGGAPGSSVVGGGTSFCLCDVYNSKKTLLSRLKSSGGRARVLQEPKLKGINLPKHMNVRKLSPFAKDRMAKAERLNEEERLSLAKRRVECDHRLLKASSEQKTENASPGDGRVRRDEGGESDRSVERETRFTSWSSCATQTAATSQ